MKKHLMVYASCLVLSSLLYSGCSSKNDLGSSNSAATSTKDQTKSKSTAGKTDPNTANSSETGTTRPMYYNREVTAQDLEGRTLRDLSLLRNTIFARAGNPFRKQWLREYFLQQPWYKPAEHMDDSKLTALDRKNAAFIAEYETGIPREELERRKQKLLEKPDTDLTKADRIELSLLLRSLGETEVTKVENVTPLDDPRQLDKLLTVDQLNDYSRRDLRLLRNTVYARRGRPFKSPILRDYFSRMEWYQADSKYSDNRLTEIDKKNINLIRSVEDQLGGPMTDSEQNQDAWFGAA